MRSIRDPYAVYSQLLHLPFVWLPFESGKKALRDLGKPALLRPSAASA